MMNENIKVIRENEEEKKILTEESFVDELLFQIKEDTTTQEEYEEEKEEGYKYSFEHYITEKLNRLLDEFYQGYSIDIMGDTYSMLN